MHILKCDTHNLVACNNKLRQIAGDRLKNYNMYSLHNIQTIKHVLDLIIWSLDYDRISLEMVCD